MTTVIPTTPSTVVDRGLVRFLTCGSVDDGKSTLIGRLLFDTKSILSDTLANITSTSQRKGLSAVDLSLLTDGLQAEREQGITIDVAYRYFSTGTRKYIIADCPGHEQYTRNMATGASTADVAIILIDARLGVLPQSRRHGYIAHLLGIRHIVVAINKMDLVGYDPKVYEAIRAEYSAVLAKFGATADAYIPVSALLGHNIVTRGDEDIPWYQGPTLLEWLEAVEPQEQHESEGPARFAVQYVIRPDLHFRGFAGTLARGRLHVDETVLVLPAGRRTTIKRIHTVDGDLAVAHAGQAVTLVLADEIDISRGDMIVALAQPPAVVQHINAHVVWFDAQAAQGGKNYLLRHTSRTVPAKLTQVQQRVDLKTLNGVASSRLQMNDLGTVQLELAKPIFADDYQESRATGSFVLIDRQTHITVAAGMVLQPQHDSGDQFGPVDAAQRQRYMGQTAATVTLAGPVEQVLPALQSLERVLLRAGHPTLLVDAPVISETQLWLERANLIVLHAQIAPALHVTVRSGAQQCQSELSADSDTAVLQGRIQSYLRELGALPAGSEYDI